VVMAWFMPMATILSPDACMASRKTGQQEMSARVPPLPRILCCRLFKPLDLFWRFVVKNPSTKTRL